MSTIGENIKLARIKKGLTQQDLATALGTTKSAISRYELGKREPKYRLLQKIAQVLDTNSSELIGNADIELELRRSALRSDIEDALHQTDDFDNQIEAEILTYYRQLNFEGKQVAADYLAKMVGSQQYKKNS